MVVSDFYIHKGKRVVELVKEATKHLEDAAVLCDDLVYSLEITFPDSEKYYKELDIRDEYLDEIIEAVKDARITASNLYNYITGVD